MKTCRCQWYLLGLGVAAGLLAGCNGKNDQASAPSSPLWIQGVEHARTANDPAAGFTGPWKRPDPSTGEWSVESYVNGQLNGTTTVYRKDGAVAVQLCYREGWRHGPLLRWYPNGQKESEEIWKNGKHDGRQEFWHPNGARKWVRFYQSGQAHGRWEYWDQDGQPTKTETYERGQLVADPAAAATNTSATTNSP